MTAFLMDALLSLRLVRPSLLLLRRCSWLLLVSCLLAATARAEPVLYVPFPCEQSWFGRTYTGHSGGGAGEFAIDWVEQSTAGSPTGSPGRPVLASAAGVVLPVSVDKRGYGNYVDLDHGDGLVTRYAHLSKVLVKAHQQVASGTQLGLTGATGSISRPGFAHLHYEQRQNGKIRRALFDGKPFSYVYTAPGFLKKSDNCGDKPEQQSLLTPSRIWWLTYSSHSYQMAPMLRSM
jgi:hypothetical protein